MTNAAAARHTDIRNTEHNDRRRTARRRRPLTPYQKLARWFRKNFLAIAVSVILGLGVAAGSICTATYMSFRASSTVRDYGRELMYAEYTVKSGDTMWDIAVDMAALNPEFRDVRQYLHLLQKTNHNYGDYLQSGTTILIPYYDGGDATPMFEAYLKYNIAGYEQWLEMLDGQD